MQSNSFFLSLPLLDSILFGMRLIRQFFRDLQDISSKTWPKKLLRIIIATWGLHHQLLKQKWNNWRHTLQLLNVLKSLTIWRNVLDLTFQIDEVQMIFRKKLFTLTHLWNLNCATIWTKVLDDNFCNLRSANDFKQIGILHYLHLKCSSLTIWPKVLDDNLCKLRSANDLNKIGILDYLHWNDHH